jgi:phosphohistidine phosphatase
MKKHLLIMRHAKSSWDNSQLADFQRPLNDRGVRDVPRMAQFLSQQQSLPSFIASSTAVRARQTTELFLNSCPNQQKIEVDWVESFYHAPAQIYIDYLRNLAQTKTDSVMVVGHNPGLEELFRRLTGHLEHFPTAAVAKLEVDSDCWRSFSAERCRLIALWCPKEVTDPSLG